VDDGSFKLHNPTVLKEAGGQKVSHLEKLEALVKATPTLQGVCRESPQDNIRDRDCSAVVGRESGI
jgi:hypothetical protein